MKVFQIYCGWTDAPREAGRVLIEHTYATKNSANKALLLLAKKKIYDSLWIEELEVKEAP